MGRYGGHCSSALPLPYSFICRRWAHWYPTNLCYATVFVDAPGPRSSEPHASRTPPHTQPLYTRKSEFRHSEFARSTRFRSLDGRTERMRFGTTQGLCRPYKFQEPHFRPLRPIPPRCIQEVIITFSVGKERHKDTGEKYFLCPMYNNFSLVQYSPSFLIAVCRYLWNNNVGHTFPFSASSNSLWMTSARCLRLHSLPSYRALHSCTMLLAAPSGRTDAAECASR